MSATDRAQRKERLEARLTSEQKRHIEQAAQIRGTSVSDFVILSADEAAKRTIRDQEVLILNERARKVFAQALLHPPVPGKRLLAAARLYEKQTGVRAATARRNAGRRPASVVQTDEGSRTL